MNWRVAGAFAPLLAHERDAPSCRAISDLDAGEYGAGNDVPFRYSIRGQAS
jgi:hypothetical protein